MAEMINKTGADGPQPFSGLAPEVVLDAAAAAGLDPDGRLFALNSYENRVYQLGAGPGLVVLKFYRPGRWSDAQIVEEHTFTQELAAAELPVAAPLLLGGQTLCRYRDFRFAAFPWMRGHAPELDAPEARQILGRSLARLHEIGATRAFSVRPRIDVERLGWQARAQVLRSALLPDGLRERYATVSGALLECVSTVFAATAGVRAIRIHGDCHLGNLLWNEHGPVFVDLDDCAMGVRMQDLWMLISGSPAEQQRQWADLLEGYQQFATLDFTELQLVEPLRGLRMLHHAAWVSHRWRDPAFPRAFPWFGEARYWEGYLQDLAEQIETIADPPLLRGR
ncbi:MAG TPA: serine/threonine protein kinase [Steroidobacteraceae bacterium]|jgi:Ser/Thr protein kinase RdoA (MazF antagonist)|nr:serine/threonine protein kinase [Steroidobacteraceae bacterium]